jgi:putative DNA methylase
VYNVIETSFDIPFISDLALREKQIQQNYRPIIAVHKWFARRPGTLFRGLLLSEFVNENLKDAFFQSHKLSGLRVLDPFMGGGTPLIEANRLGCGIVGYDINPIDNLDQTNRFNVVASGYMNRRGAERGKYPSTLNPNSLP